MQEEDVRIGQTVIYLEEKLEKIETQLDCLMQGQRYQDFSGDPFEVSPWDCSSCGIQPEARKKSNGKWEFFCPSCGKSTVGKDKWEVILRWNRGNCSTKTLEEIPFRALHENSAQHQNIITYLCNYYYLKKKQVGLTRQIAQLTGERPPGKRYQKKLTAFYEWALLGKEMLKQLSPETSSQTAFSQECR